MKVRNLLALEEWVKKLWSPPWPEKLGTIDARLRDEGRKAFLKAKCNACHHDIDRTDRFRRVEGVMQAVGTEDITAANFNKRKGDTGMLEGAYLKVVGSPILGSPRFTDKAGGDELLSHFVIGTILRSPFQAPQDELTQIDYKRKQAMITGVGGPVIGNGGLYKARPLNGIWASAPYLHNGSVPTLADLLLPAKKRPKSFTVGSREFDPAKVGFRTDAPGFSVYRARNDDGTPVPGNSNEGHEFGTDAYPPTAAEYLNDDERKALLEYLKSL